MSVTDIIGSGPDRAAEYVLGLLPRAEADAVRAQMMQDEDLRGRVAFWQTHFVGLTDDIAPVTPPNSVFVAVTERLFGKPQPLIKRIGWLRALAGAATAALAVLLVVAVLAPPAGPSPTSIVTLASAEEDLLLRIGYFADDNRLVTHPEPPLLRDGRDTELWIIIGDQAPRSLGVISSIDDMTVVLPEDLVGIETAILAISDEPIGGSPTGAPTGAILALSPIFN